LFYSKVMIFYLRKVSLLHVLHSQIFPAILLPLAVILIATQLPGCRANDDLSPCDGSTVEVLIHNGPANPEGLRLTWYNVPREDVSFHDPALAPDGTIWYTATAAGKIGRYNPDNVDDVNSLTALNGTIWFTAPRSNAFGRLDPGTGEYTVLRR
jgi:streptogramin lyase